MSVNFNSPPVDIRSVAKQVDGNTVRLDELGNKLQAVTSGITAFATGGQASAIALTSGINEISVCATIGDSVKLPTAVAGLTVSIINNGATACDVFPFSGDDLGAGVDTAASLAIDAGITYACYDSTNWHSV